MSCNNHSKIKKYFINTYGCQMNVHESEKISGIFSSLNLIKAEAIEDADYVVYNTCSVRETAETRVFGHLGQAKKLKESNPLVKIILCGCMGQRPGGAAVIRKKFPFVDLIIGTHNIHLLSEYVSRIDHKRVLEVFEHTDDAVKDRLIGDTKAGILRNNPLSAFVNIMQGCDNFCSYCIVPYVRGREISRSKRDILSEIRSLIDQGYKEITLLGQNVNSYGKTIFGGAGEEKSNFASLLHDISLLDGDFWVKFMTSHPKDFTEDTVKIIAGSDKLKKHVHLPVQAGSDRILRQMNRGYTFSEYLKKIDLIRKYIPEAGITSDIMVGFPGETEEDFLDTLRLVASARYNNLFTFIYNKREGTPAATMDGQLPREVKVERLSRLISLQNGISESIAKACVGKTYKVLCENVKGGKGYGKTENEQPISFKADEFTAGRFIKVEAVNNKNSNVTGILKG